MNETMDHTLAAPPVNHPEPMNEPQTGGGLYGDALEGPDRELYLRADELDVTDEIRLVRVKANAALVAGDDPAVRAWLDLLVRLCNVALRMGLRDDADDDFLELVRKGG